VVALANYTVGAAKAVDAVIEPFVGGAGTNAVKMEATFVGATFTVGAFMEHQRRLEA
jgi:hypothetical protein